MTESQKLVTSEELEHLRNLQEAYVRLTKQYGELKYDQLALNAQLEDLEDQMITLENGRIEAIRQLQERFGSSGTVSLDTGEFIPE